MSQSRAMLVRVLLIRRGDQWLAQGLDYNLAAQAPSQAQAANAFVRMLVAHIKHDAALGREPLYGISAAPEHYLRLWQASQDQQPILTQATDDLSDVPPAYVLQAIAPNGNELNQ